MIELMKRFQDETGIDLFGGWTYKIVNGMMNPPLSDSPWMKFTEWLAKQLTWRPVSENPEKDGEYFVKFHYADGEEGMDVCSFTKGEWYWDSIISWLPIPPTPEGE